MENQNLTTAQPERDIEVVTTEIKTLRKQAQQMALMYAIEIGARLKEAKGILAHGEWGDWLKDRAEFSQSTAQNFIRIYEEYGSEQLQLFGKTSNSQTLGNLPYTKALKLLAIPADEREEFVQEHRVEDMSTRDLDALIKERDEAMRAAEDARMRTDIAEEAAADAAKKLEELEHIAQEKEEFMKTFEKLKEAVASAKEQEKRAKAKLDELKQNPQVPESAIKKIKAEAAAKAAEDAQAEINKQLEDMQKRLQEITAQKEKAERDAEALKVRAALANPEVVQFKAIFEQLQEALRKLGTLINSIKQQDADTAGKLQAALRQVVQQYI